MRMVLLQTRNKYEYYKNKLMNIIMQCYISVPFVPLINRVCTTGQYTFRMGLILVKYTKIFCHWWSSMYWVGPENDIIFFASISLYNKWNDFTDDAKVQFSLCIVISHCVWFTQILSWKKIIYKCESSNKNGTTMEDNMMHKRLMNYRN